MRKRSIIRPKPMAIMIWKIQTGISANKVLPDCCSNLRNVIDARIKKKQTVAAKRLTTMAVTLLAGFDSSRESASILICRFSFVANDAPIKPIQRTKWRINVSPQRIEVEKKFLKITCRKASKIIESRMIMRKNDSILARMLLIE